MDPAARAQWSRERPGRDHPFDTACPAPWVSMEFDPAGWVLACCAGHMYPLGRVGDEPLAEIWHGQRAQVLRDSLRRWDLTVACVSCRWHLEHGRMDPVAAVYDAYPVVAERPTGPYMMQFALSNRCNLGCVMCNPELSSRLRSEAGLAPIPSRYDDRFFEELEPLVRDLGLAKFQGGEPFLIPEHRRVWELLAGCPRPPRILVTTNGTIWNDTVEWVLDTFEVDVSVSIDAATPGTYAQVRRGGEFDRVLENVERFDAACREKGTAFHVSYCLMDRNWDELAPFLAWAEAFDSSASVNLVTDHGLALHDLPTEVLEEISARWREQDLEWGPALQRNEGVWQTQIAQLDSVLGERRAGRPPSPRQPEPSAADALAPVHGAAGVRPGPIAAHRDRLGAWSGGAAVGVIEVGTDRVVRAVPRPHDRLGIDPGLVGEPVDRLIDVIGRADGRPVWLLDRAVLEDCVVRTFGLSETASRGTPGTMVRTVEVPGGGGATFLVAEDRIYERSEAAVMRPARRPVVPPDPRRAGT